MKKSNAIKILENALMQYCEDCIGTDKKEQKRIDTAWRTILRKSIKKKLCEIINSQFCWILKVDGVEIPFQGYDYADYFKEHYKKIGYKVVFKENNI